MTSPRSLKLSAAGAVAALAVAAAPAAAAPTVVATEAAPFTVSASPDGAVAWSHKDATTGRFSLMLRSADGVTKTLPAAPSTKAFDVDLGTGADGALLAVYSQGGKLHTLDVASGKDAIQQTGVGGRLSEPTVADGRIAFISRSHGRVRLYLLSAGAAKAKLVATAKKKSDVQDPELSAKRLVYVATGAGKYGFGSQTIRVRDLKHISRARSVYTATSGGANEADVRSPSFDANGSHLYWARTNQGSGVGNRLIRLTLSTNRGAVATGSDRIVSAAWTGAHGFALAEWQPDQDTGTDLVSTGPVSFTAQK